MDGAQIKVIDETDKGKIHDCGTLEISSAATSRNGQTIPCGDLACGDKVELTVHKKDGAIMVNEIQALRHYGLCIISYLGWYNYDCL